MKVYIISLGCPKNLTDTEVIMGKLASSGYQITTKPKKSDIIIINTCAFLKTARDEVKATVKEMKKYQKPIYLAGCFPKLKPKTKLPGVVGTIDSLGLFNCQTPRIKATPSWYAYVKIAEGCNNCCAYCLIPTIRGRLKTRPVKDILTEVKLLAKRGVKEIIFVAQDTTAHPKFADILRKSTKIKGIRWIRIMYAHPAHLGDNVINVIAKEPKIVKYLDLPIQHCCDRILSQMNRRYCRHDLKKLIAKIRRRIPKIVLRSSIIVGFPGEGEVEFQELLTFIKEFHFEKLGVFQFQKEPGTPAAKMRGQVPAKKKKERFNKLMRLQKGIAEERNQKLIGQTIETIIEGPNWGRSCFDAPEIDGRVLIKNAKTLTPGEIKKVKVLGARAYDLIGFVT